MGVCSKTLVMCFFFRPFCWFFHLGRLVLQSVIFSKVPCGWPLRVATRSYVYTAPVIIQFILSQKVDHHHFSSQISRRGILFILGKFYFASTPCTQTTLIARDIAKLYLQNANVFSNLVPSEPEFRNIVALGNSFRETKTMSLKTRD